MLLAVEIATESIVSVVAVLAGGVALLYRQMRADAKDRLADQAKQYETRIAEVLSERKSYVEITKEAISNLEKRVNEERRLAGKKDFDVIAPVVPEHNSPVTEAQQDTADLQTFRARLTAATLALGLPPRESGKPEALETVTEKIEELKSDVAKIPDKVVEKINGIRPSPVGDSEMPAPTPKFKVGDHVDHPAAKDKSFPAGCGTVTEVLPGRPPGTSPVYRVRCDQTGEVLSQDFKEVDLKTS